MKKGEIYEGVVERIDFPNKGRVHVEGETVTVKNAIPGQKIRFQINKKRKNRRTGKYCRPDRAFPSGIFLQYFPVLRRMHVPDDEL